ncbi:Monoglyceride lipase [Phytophthora cinnamomi]|uniref:Monoglyceride lipase n=1 Tax=Phytophthora cinnamomi TaxID=4785 RepID=UPI00355A1B9B|nr:Monoglyceride lipase [Phytophthora cinnamomi]
MEGSARLRSGPAAPATAATSISVAPSESAPVPRYSRPAPRSASVWPRLLLGCGVLYVVGLVLFIAYSRPNSLSNVPVPLEQELETFSSSSNSQSDAAAIARAEEHARHVKMLPQGGDQRRELRCVGWRATDGCSPHGPRLPHKDKPCHMMVPHTESGYCEVEDRTTKERFRVMRRYCRSVRQEGQFRCFDAQDFVNFPLEARQARRWLLRVLLLVGVVYGSAMLLWYNSRVSDLGLTPTLADDSRTFRPRFGEVEVVPVTRKPLLERKKQRPRLILSPQGRAAIRKREDELKANSTTVTQTVDHRNETLTRIKTEDPGIVQVRVAQEKWEEAEKHAKTVKNFPRGETNPRKLRLAQQ